MNPRLKMLLEVFDQGFKAPAWHGTPLRGSIRGISAKQAQWRPGPGRHSIWELVLHTAYWKCIVRRRLLRDPDIGFPREGSNWFDLPTPASEAAWKRDRALLDKEHALLRRAILKVAPAQLDKRGWRSQWRTKQEIYGIASHDLYHAGQIQVLKKLYRS